MDSGRTTRGSYTVTRATRERTRVPFQARTDTCRGARPAAAPTTMRPPASRRRASWRWICGSMAGIWEGWKVRPRRSSTRRPRVMFCPSCTLPPSSSTRTSCRSSTTTAPRPRLPVGTQVASTPVSPTLLPAGATRITAPPPTRAAALRASPAGALGSSDQEVGFSSFMSTRAVSLSRDTIWRVPPRTASSAAMPESRKRSTPGGSRRTGPTSSSSASSLISAAPGASTCTTTDPTSSGSQSHRSRP
mmetsp:Transcript_52999/g.168172  ORF Transcript_52999/g.168172 Transcript_52999/m.168172 type:complete len:247 (+) Transcript_52999:1866-2606(+)